jgi:hypothetical protein
MTIQRFSRFLLSAVLIPAVYASDGGGSVYPVGAETVVPGLMPPPGKTIPEEFDNFYQANGVMDASGHSVVPGFHLRVGALAVKVVHNRCVRP